MRSTSLRCLLLLALLLLFVLRAASAPQSGGDFSSNPDAKKLPTGVILVKGAWSSASDSATPDPEGGKVSKGIYTNDYFGLSYPLPAGWAEKYTGPPPSDRGYYVLAQIRPADTNKEPVQGSIMISAQDIFFTLTPAQNALEMINFTKDHLIADHQVESQPAPVTIAGHSFIRLDYFSPLAELHWHVLATQIRCHTVEFVFTTKDAKLTESLIQQMDNMKLPAEASPISGTGGDQAPLCIRDYARDENIIERDDPVFGEHRFNPVPVRIIIGTDGKIKHIHFLSAFPDQAKQITDALAQWRFKPYLLAGKPVEVETGILFGRPPRSMTPAAAGAVNE